MAIPPVRFKTKGAFSLVEVTMAIGLMSFCLVAMVGMLPVGLSQERRSTDQLLSLQALTAVAADFKNWKQGQSASAKYRLRAGSNVPLELDENLDLLSEASSSSGGKQFHITYTLEEPATAFANYRLSVRVVRTTQSNPTNEQNLNCVESVVLKPAS